MSIDPTAIPIQFDPVQQRMIGTAVHGDTPFDVPFISHIEGNLWMGGCKRGLILPAHIEHVVSLYPWEKYRGEPKSYLEITMYDSNEEPDIVQVRAAAQQVRIALANGVTLVHCQAGLNRSGLIAAMTLMLQGRTAREAIDLLREKRSPAVLCNPAFEAFLLRGLT